MARSRTPTKILEAKGAFKKDPQRRRDNEPVVSAPFPDAPPADMTLPEIIQWRKIVGMVPDGVLTGADLMQVNMLASLAAEWWEDRPAFSAAKLGRMCIIMGTLGLNPAGRAALIVPKKDDDEF